MNSTERLFTFKVSLIMGVRMLGLFTLFPVMSVYASKYTNSSPLLIGLAIGIYGLISKRNAIRLLFAVEIIINAAFPQNHFLIIHSPKRFLEKHVFSNDHLC